MTDFEITEPLVWDEQVDPDGTTVQQAQAADAVYEVGPIVEGDNEGRWLASITYGQPPYFNTEDLGVFDDGEAARLRCQRSHEINLTAIRKLTEILDGACGKDQQ